MRMKKLNLIFNKIYTLCLSGVPSYKSIIDWLTFVDVELRTASYEILEKFFRVLTKLG